MKRLVSCIVPVFNGERYLAEALDSIFAQTWRPLEVIVVDDGSTDGTPSVAARYGDRITCIRQPNAGPAAARNRGLSAARGDFVAFLDADDHWHRDKLARQMARFEAQPRLELCSAHSQNFWVPELKQEEERLSDSGLAAPQPGFASVVLMRRALFDRIGPFDADLRHRDQMEWLSRAKGAGTVMETLPEVLVFRRIHRDNISRQRVEADHDELLQSIKSMLDRRRDGRDSNVGKWRQSYQDLDRVMLYGDATTYRLAADFLADVGLVEDWGCGTGGFRLFCRCEYIGVDGSENRYVDRTVDLVSYTSDVDGVLLRHVLEHNPEWERILDNALTSCRKKLCLVLFTPFADRTEQIRYYEELGIGDIAFKKEDLIRHFDQYDWSLDEGLETDTQYGVEHVFYIEK